jgi:hypothetical protein
MIDRLIDAAFRFVAVGFITLLFAAFVLWMARPEMPRRSHA